MSEEERPLGLSVFPSLGTGLLSRAHGQASVPEDSLAPSCARKAPGDGGRRGEGRAGTRGRAAGVGLSCLGTPSPAPAPRLPAPWSGGRGALECDPRCALLADKKMMSSAPAAGTQQIYSQGSPFPPGHSGKAFRYARLGGGLGAVAAPLVWGQQDEAGSPRERLPCRPHQPAPDIGCSRPRPQLPDPPSGQRQQGGAEAGGEEGAVGDGNRAGKAWPTVSRAWEQRSRGPLGTQRDRLQNALSEAWKAAGRETLGSGRSRRRLRRPRMPRWGAGGEEGLGETGSGRRSGGRRGKGGAGGSQDTWSRSRR